MKFIFMTANLDTNEYMYIFREYFPDGDTAGSKHVANLQTDIHIVIFYLLRICCADGHLITLHSNTQLDANNKDNITKSCQG